MVGNVNFLLLKTDYFKNITVWSNNHVTGTPTVRVGIEIAKWIMSIVSENYGTLTLTTDYYTNTPFSKEKDDFIVSSHANAFPFSNAIDILRYYYLYLRKSNLLNIHSYNFLNILKLNTESSVFQYSYAFISKNGISTR